MDGGPYSKRGGTTCNRQILTMYKAFGEAPSVRRSISQRGGDSSKKKSRQKSIVRGGGIGPVLSRAVGVQDRRVVKQESIDSFWVHNEDGREDGNTSREIKGRKEREQVYLTRSFERGLNQVVREITKNGEKEEMTTVVE